MSDTKPVIIVNNVAKQFGIKPVLKKVNLTVEAGEFVALMGPNGAGKTTLLRILSSLAKPSFGVVQIAGLELPGQAAAVRSKLGVLSHLPLLYGDLTAEQNLSFFGQLYNIQALEARITEILELVGLKRRRRDLVRTFSRGMEQRLSIGRAILHDPEILLLDEPYTGLDQDAGNILDSILRLIASEGRTIMMTSHDLSRSANLASRFDVLSRGKIVASAQRDDIPRDGLLGFYRRAVEGGGEGA